MVLKNWTKKSDTKFVNKRRNGILYIGKSLFTGKPDVSIALGKVRIGNKTTGYGLVTKTAIYKQFNQMSSARRFAKDFMKKH